MTNVDKALLMAEWRALRYDGVRACLVCEESAEEPYRHRPGCVLDLALAERGFATQIDRDAARAGLAALAPTIAPPAPERP